MRLSTILLTISTAAATLAGCAKGPAPYGVESPTRLPGELAQVWAVAPALNLSGQRGVDPLLQADLVFQEVQSVRGVTAIPVNRVAEAYAALGIGRVETPEQAQLVCEMIGADALVVPTVTIWDPYDPPKIGAAVQLFPRGGARFANAPAMDLEAVRQLARSGRESQPLTMPAELPRAFAQAAGLFDARHGSTRLALERYALGRNDPEGPAAGARLFALSMDRYAAFAYGSLVRDLVAGLAPADALASR